MEKPYYRSDGTMIWTDLVVSLIRDQDGHPRYMVAMMEDITERHELHARLRHQALHDPLTGLPNRTMFFERLDAAWPVTRRTGSGCATSISTASRRSTTRSATTSATSC